MSVKRNEPRRIGRGLAEFELVEPPADPSTAATSQMQLDPESVQSIAGGLLKTAAALADVHARIALLEGKPDISSYLDRLDALEADDAMEDTAIATLDAHLSLEQRTDELWHTHNMAHDAMSLWQDQVDRDLDTLHDDMPDLSNLQVAIAITIIISCLALLLASLALV